MSVKQVKRMLLLLTIVLVSTSIILLDTITSKTESASAIDREYVVAQRQQRTQLSQTRKRPVIRQIDRRNTRKILQIIRNSLNQDQESPIHLNLTSAKASKHEIRLNYAKRCYGGTACRLGIITSEKLTQAPAILTGAETTLGTGITGYFVDSNCGANCSDATISWDENGRRYSLGLKAGKKGTLVKMANELREHELRELVKPMEEIPIIQGFLREEMGGYDRLIGKDRYEGNAPVEENLSYNKQRGSRYLNRIIESIPEYLGLRPYAWDSIPLILRECYRSGVRDRGQIAYILATAEHESGLGKWMEELASGWAYEGRSDLGNDRPGDGPRYKGRGFVQITGRRNYTDWSDRLGIDLVRFPEKAAEPEIAAKILVLGMKDGTFTGHRLGEYIWGYKRDFYYARRIVNHLDRAAWIAAIAEAYYEVL